MTAADDSEGWRVRARRVLTWVLSIALVVSVVGVGYVAVAPPQLSDPHTEFYLLNDSGAASGYPTQLAPGESGTVVVGISNHEQRSVEYRVAVTWNGSRTSERSVSIPDGNTEELQVELTAPDESGRYRVRFLLFDETGTEPSLQNRLLIDVRGPDETGNRSA